MTDHAPHRQVLRLIVFGMGMFLLAVLAIMVF